MIIMRYVNHISNFGDSFLGLAKKVEKGGIMWNNVEI